MQGESIDGERVSKLTGRPTKLTQAIFAAIVQAVSGGVPYIRAAAMADVRVETAMEWRRRGENTDRRRPTTPLYAQFAQALKKAEAQDEARRVLRINQAGQGGQVTHEKTITYPDGRIVHEVSRTRPEWQADAWHLERSQPDVWGRRERLDIRLNIEHAAAKVAADLGMTPEEVLAEAQALLHELDHGATTA